MADGADGGADRERDLHSRGAAGKRPDRLYVPLFFGAGATVAADDLTLPVDPAALGSSFTLTGPSPALAPGHVPVRGDLAHIGLAGKCFVPHYAVPMPHVVRAGGALLGKAAGATEVLERLAAGARFDVLEISAGWCWGQAGTDGLVGYVAVDKLEAVAA